MRCLRCCAFLHIVALPCSALLDVLSLFGGKRTRRSIGEYDFEGGDGQEYEDVAEGDLAPGQSGPTALLNRTNSKYVRVVRKHRQKRQATFVGRRAPAAEFCPTYSGTGWHSGSYEAELRPRRSPNGIMWTWEDCARECASRDECQFWTLQLKKGSCYLMSKQGQYHDTTGHIEGPKDLGCMKVQPSGPYAGEYEVRYHRQKRSENMIVHCNSSVSQPGVLTDFQKYDPRNFNFHIADTPATQCLRKMPRSTVFIFNTQDPSKFECLQQDGVAKLLGSRYYASGQLFGDVEYHLIKTFTCAYEVLNDTNETVLTETVNEVTSDDEETEEEAEEAPEVDPATGQPREIEAEAFPAEAWSREESAEGGAEPASPPAAEGGEAPAAATVPSRRPSPPDDDEEHFGATGAVAAAVATGSEAASPARAAAALAAQAQRAQEGVGAEAPEAAAADRAAAGKGAAMCMLWCADHTDEWAMKCTFAKCRGCHPCAAKAPVGTDADDSGGDLRTPPGAAEAEAPAAPAAAHEEAPAPAPAAAAREEKEASSHAPAAAPTEPPAAAGGAKEAAADEPAAEPPAPVELHSLRRSRRVWRRGSGSWGGGSSGGDGEPPPASAARAGVPQMWQQAALVQYLGWTLDSGLSKIKENVDAHLQKIQNLTTEAQGSNGSLESLSQFLGDLSEVSGNRQRLGALVSETLEEMKLTLTTTGHESMMPALEDCLEANGQASTLADWYFGLAGLANGAESSKQSEVVPTEDRERILALDSNGIEFKRHEDGLASRFRSTFQTLTKEIELPKAVAGVPQAKQQLDELLDQVLHKATGVSWSLHTSAVGLASLVRAWSASIGQAGAP